MSGGGRPGDPRRAPPGRVGGAGKGGPAAGLCATCAHVRVVGNRRGSRFYRCGLSESHSGFSRYPRLPVLACRGHTPAGDETGDGGE